MALKKNIFKKYIFIIFVLYFILWGGHALFLYILTGHYFQYNMIYGRDINDSKNKNLFINEIEYNSFNKNIYAEDYLSKKIVSWVEKPKYIKEYYYFGFHKTAYNEEEYRICFLNTDSSAFFIDDYNITNSSRRGIQSIGQGLPATFNVQITLLEKKVFYLYTDSANVFGLIDSGYFSIRR